jgi:hypothetical protein
VAVLDAPPDGVLPPREYLPPYTAEQLLAIAERITARYDPADREDAAQEFVLGALQAASRLFPESPGYPGVPGYACFRNQRSRVGLA